MRTLKWGLVGFLLGIGVVIIAQLPRWERSSFSVDDSRPAYRAAALRDLGRVFDEKSVIKALSDVNEDIRVLAAYKLGGEGHKGDERAWALLPMLDDPRRAVRREAAWSLALIGEPAWPAVEQALKGKDPRVRLEAIWGLLAILPSKPECGYWPGQHMAVILAVLEKLSRDPDVSLNSDSKRMLARLKGQPEP